MANQRPSLSASVMESSGAYVRKFEDVLISSVNGVLNEVLMDVCVEDTLCTSLVEPS